MAKKKVSNTHNDKALQTQEEAVKPQQETPSPMESDKFESLKSLNQRLLKDEIERRQQVEALLQSKASLETELSRSKSEREALDSESARLVERAAVLEVERTVVAVFVDVQVGVKGEKFNLKIKGLEMETRELRRESEEKEIEIVGLKGTLSEIEERLARQIEEDEGLRENLTDLNGKMMKFQREIEELRTAYNVILREKDDKEMRINALMEDKGSSERGLMESHKLLEKMKEEIILIVGEKESLEKEKKEEMVKRIELENTVSGLNELSTKLQTVVAELEKNCIEGEVKVKDMEMDIARLVNEMNSSEKRIQELVEANSMIKKNLEEAVKELAEQKRETEGLASEKIVAVEAKARVDGEVVELRNLVEELKAAVSELDELNKGDVEKIGRLESQVVEYKLRVDEEKEKGLKLKGMVEELEKSAGEVKAANAAILSEKVELERRCGMQGREIASLQKTVVEARNEFGSLKSRVELADEKSERVLKMLKGASAFCCSKDDEDGESNLVDNDENVKWHAMELRAIMRTFKRRAEDVEEMKRQLECLQISVVDAEKKKSFWTVFSSATTVLAAVSLAYVARGR